LNKTEQVTRKDISVRSFVAHIRAASVDREKRTFDVVWTTGARVLRPSYMNPVRYEPFYEELSTDPSHVRLDRLNNGAPFLNSHQRSDLSTVLGVVESGSARMDGTQGLAKVRMSNRPEVQPYVQDIADEVIQNISTGYRTYRYEQLPDAEDGVMVLRATDWEPTELSAVPVGADDGAGFRSEAQTTTNPCEIVTRSNKDQEKQTMTPEQIAAQQADQARAAEKTAKDAADAATTAERSRVDGITQAVRTAKLDPIFGDKLVKDGTSLDKARALIIDELAKKDAQVTTEQHTRVEAGEDARDKFVRGASDWLLIRSGQADAMKKAGQQVDAGEFRGLTLVELARFSLDRAGVNTRGMDKMKMVGLAFTRVGANGTSDFSVLLENTMHKSLQAGYAITPDTWSRFCARGSVSDFRSHKRYLRGTFGTLDSLNESGEFKRKQIPDGQKQSITAATKGNIISITRQAIVNDDMESFSTLPQLFGRAAKLSVEADVYTTLGLNSGLGPNLSDGNPLFYSSRSATVNGVSVTVVNNITTGAALTASAIDADRVAMGSFRDISGNEILDLRPAILLVPLSLGGSARVINDSQYDPDTVANKSQMKPNLVRGLFRDIVDTGRLTGTRRYLFADPNIAPVLEVAFLDGQDQPFLETETGWTIDGTEMKVRLDYGVAGVGYHGAVTNAGA
jgi:hypothetical protein